MSQRRMFSPQIVESEEFLTMPVSSQALYFHLGMNADDDGFIQPKIVMRTTGANDDDLKVLLSKRFLLSFEGGVVVVKHWLIHNLIQKDRYHPTRFQEEKKTLFIKENKAYTDNSDSVNKMLTQVRLGKVRLGKENTSNEEIFSEEENQEELESEVVPDDDVIPTREFGKKKSNSKQKSSLQGFESFWNIYPNKADKKSASAEWRKLTDKQRALVMADVPLRSKSEGWLKDEGKYILMAKNYFSGHRWEDPMTMPTITHKNYDE